MEKISELISRVLSIPKEKISDESSPENTEGWDSFNGLILVSELEKNFDVKFTIEEVLSVTCVKDIKTCLRNHGIKDGLD